ncbi:sigma-70 family RNA polymerase sigma factor [Actinomadura rupiterrae]|uniref:sigma-70 family RNA polymerase sigma factor n=1 Tax=Actinomadura rupiterrae TaxID=559627 RepID=UPI0020A5F799|nr:sigma-70 family RNA polymerase sigma factor [Actinomadura rupiterrae]MCP2337736.1 RNA polymerase sigma factor (sigma-70 family) [Actinomadura rupiterrae]
MNVPGGLPALVGRGGTGVSDEELVASARTGDEAASAELYRRHHRAVLGYARGLVRDPHTAEDLTAEAFTRMFAALRAGSGPQVACRPYLYTVVRNAAVDWARAGRRTVVTDEVAAWADESGSEPPDVDEQDTLVRAFRSLPERWQTVLWHTVIEDEPVQQVADVLDMKAGAVTQLAFRAREGLRQAFLAASCEGRPECAEYTRQLAAIVRRPGRRKGRALREHLETCEYCRRAAEDMRDLNGRLRAALPIGAVLLAVPALRHAGPSFLRGWALKAAIAGTAAVVTAVLFTVFYGDGKPGHHPQAGPSNGAPIAPSASSPPGPAPSGPKDYPAASTQGNGSRPDTRGKGPSKKSKPAAAGANGPYRLRNTSLRSCLVPSGSSLSQQYGCSGSDTIWQRTAKAGGFTLKSSSGQCMTRGPASSSVFWEGGTQYSVVLAPCGGANQIWKLVSFSPGFSRLSNGDGWYLQASWSGLSAPVLKQGSPSGTAAQGWEFDRP